MPATPATETIELLGLRVRHLVRGAGPPVLVLHGWGASIEAVYPIVAGLQALATVHALDLPGFGASEPPPEPWGVEDYQRLLAAYMDHMGLGASTAVGDSPTAVGGSSTATGGSSTATGGRPAIGDGPAATGRTAIVAHSNGGRIAIRMAATEPQRIGRLVLVDAAGIRPPRTFRWYRRVAMAKVGKHAARWFGPPGRWLRDALVGRAASADYAAAGELRPTLVKLVNAELRPYLPDVRAPTLLIWGSEDADTPVWMAREMERLIPDAGLVLLQGAGHFSYADQPDRFNRIVAHFLVPPSPDDPAPRAAETPAPGTVETPATPTVETGGEGSPGATGERT